MITALACGLTGAASASEITSLNRVPLRADPAQPLRILVAGHLYGDPRGASLQPAKTFLAALGGRLSPQTLDDLLGIE